MTTIIPMFPPLRAAPITCPAEDEVSASPCARVILLNAVRDDSDFDAVPESNDIKEFCKDALDAAERVKEFAVTAAALLAMSRTVMIRFVTASDLADSVELHGCLADHVLAIEGLSAIFGEAKRRLAIAIEDAQIGGAS
jgi:hypothetical protein